MRSGKQVEWDKQEMELRVECVEEGNHLGFSSSRTMSRAQSWKCSCHHLPCNVQNDFLKFKPGLVMEVILAEG